MESPDEERQYIVDYLANEAPDESVEQLEKVATERVLGRDMDVWDVHTDKHRWWVITQPTNLYLQEQFPSMDIALSFHVGLMTRVMERRERTAPDEQGERFPAAWRKWEQAGDALSEAREAEDFQAVGMRCREALIAFVQEAAGVVPQQRPTELPKASDFKGWAELIADEIAGGGSSERRRAYLKSAAKTTWDLVSWLTHAGSATPFDAYFAHMGTGHVLSSWSLSILRHEHEAPDRCPRCRSYQLRARPARNDSGESLRITECAVCGWESDPVIVSRNPEQDDELRNSVPINQGDSDSCVFVEQPLRGPKPPLPSRARWVNPPATIGAVDERKEGDSSPLGDA